MMSWIARRSSAESWLTVSLLPGTLVRLRAHVPVPGEIPQSRVPLQAHAGSLKTRRPPAYCETPMESRWSERDAAEFLERLAPRWGEDLARRVYSSRLIGSD